ncbi:MAG: TonB-dependent receptor [Polyangiaceae bacterium]|nr:TonB-dependent receptor [Polyangiaceae bacterium]
MSPRRALSTALAFTLAAAPPLTARAQGEGEGDAPPAGEPAAEGAPSDDELLAEAEGGAPDTKPVAGKGVIWGRITDTKFREPIIEGQVSVVGLKAGALTDLEGRFRVEVPPGTWTLRVFYELHRPARIERITVKAGQVARVDVELVPDERVAEEDTQEVVTELERSGVEGQSLARRRSASVSDGLGRAEIARSPDKNAAEATQRVPGASVVGGRFVYVRGLGERYTNASLNGTPLPSPEPDRQTVPLDLFPSLVLEGVTISKSFTPDMAADFAGGSVRIETRELPKQRLFQVSLGVGFNTVTTFADRFTYRGSSTDWLGYDGGTRALPDELPDFPADAQQRPDGTPTTVEERTRWARSVNAYMSAQRTTSLPNGSASLVVGDSFRLGEGKIGLLGALNYGRSYVRRHRYVQRTFTPTFATGGVGYAAATEMRGAVDTDQVRWGGFATTAWEPTRDHRLVLGYFHSQAGDLEVRDLEGENFLTDERLHYTRLGYVSRSLDYYQLRGEHTLEGAGGAVLGWNLNHSVAVREEPDARETTYTLREPLGWIYATGAQSGSHFWSDQTERGYSGGVDWTQPLGTEARPTRVKVGGALSRRERDFTARRFFYDSSGAVPLDTYTCPGSSWDPSCPDRLFRDENIWAGPPEAPLRLRDSTRKTDDYTAGLDVYAGYVMTDTSLGKRLRLVAGERIEVTRQFVKTTDDRSGSEVKVQERVRGTDLLPAAGLVFAATERSALRVSYGRTLARPQVREIAPFGFTSSYGAFEVQGNPDLKLTRIHNFDLRFEHFPTLKEVLAVSFFFKRFDDPIEEVVKPASNGTIISYDNADAANLLGVELEAREGLDFLTEALADFAVVGNLTFARSRVELSPESARVATNRSRPMSNQSPYILNLALDWADADLGMRARLLYNVYGRRITTVGTNRLPDVYEQPRNVLDFTAAKELGEHFEVKLAASNLLLSKFRTTQGKVRRPDESNVVESYETGQTYTLTATYTY